MNRYRGTAIGQDLRWKSKQAKMLKEMNAPAILTTKVCCSLLFFKFFDYVTTFLRFFSFLKTQVDAKKINIPVIEKWVV